ncbi:TonB-dependent receptor [Gaopeijia maritima]|uniref:TonB-dependent receptor n=1 Tax=Gaopeijia maritima TaxID=3119007 RepID=UPI00324BA0D3
MPIASTRAALTAAILVLGAGSPSVAAQNPPPLIVEGRVTTRDGAVVPGAGVSVEGLRIEALTDSAGVYRLIGVPSGPQVLRVEALGYATLRQALNLPTTGTVTRDFVIGVQALELDGMTVTADAVGRARGELGTSTVIGEDAIRYQSASSLAGVLELIPGTPLSPPGLVGEQQVSLRAVPTSGISGGASASDLASFGTLLVLDGVPRSNNANLQSLGARSEANFSSSAGGGVDLRSIPASTIERVEVIRGVPSARFGDLTQGVVLVDTRAGEVAPEISGKLDPRSAEVSMVAGRRADWLAGTATLAFDVARTRSAPGLGDDTSQRLAAQFSHRLEREGERRLVLDTRIDLHTLSDDRPENPNVRANSSSESRDEGFMVSERARLEWPGGSSLSFTGALGTLAQRSFFRGVKNRNTTPFTDRIEPGRAVGSFVQGGSYISELTLDGAPWMLYSRIEGDRRFDAAGLSHRLRAGLEVRREWNAGAGYQFDMRTPPQSGFNAVDGFDRPRRFDAIQPIATTSVYLDDAVRRTLSGGVVVNLQAGVRLDLLHDGSTWFSGARDVALQPRFNLEVQPRPWLRLRGGWGRTAKLPSLAQLAPSLQYYDVVNVNWYAADPAERLAILTTFTEDPTNPDLDMSRGQKMEAGLEMDWGGATLSLVAFEDRIRGGVGIDPEPSHLLRDHYQLSDSVQGGGSPPEIIEPATHSDTVPILVYRPDNNIDLTSRGVEVMALLPEIPRLRTRVQLQGTWMRTHRRSEAHQFGSYEQFSDFQLRTVRQRLPYWESLRENGWRALATWRLIHQQPDAGLVVSATIQHNILDRFDDAGGTDSLSFAGYLTRDGRRVPVPLAERGLPEYEDLRGPRSGVLVTELDTPADWLLSLQVRKTLPLDGELSFWAFNLLDRAGIYGDVDTRSRLYASSRFGFELSMPVQEVIPW